MLIKFTVSKYIQVRKNENLLLKKIEYKEHERINIALITIPYRDVFKCVCSFCVDFACAQHELIQKC